MKEPKNVYDAMRRITSLTNCIRIDLEAFLNAECPQEEFDVVEYMESVLDAAREAEELTNWLRRAVTKAAKED